MGLRLGVGSSVSPRARSHARQLPPRASGPPARTLSSPTRAAATTARGFRARTGGFAHLPSVALLTSVCWSSNSIHLPLRRSRGPQSHRLHRVTPPGRPAIEPRPRRPGGLCHLSAPCHALCPPPPAVLPASGLTPLAAARRALRAMLPKPTGRFFLSLFLLNFSQFQVYCTLVRHLYSLYSDPPNCSLPPPASTHPT